MKQEAGVPLCFFTVFIFYMKEWLDKLAGCVLTVCIIAASIVAIIVAWNYPAEKRTYNIELTVMDGRGTGSWHEKSSVTFFQLIA